MVISHNLMAMNASRQFNITGNAKKKSVEKLSSGYKINRAADDAAGLSISEKMRRQIRGLNRGTLNTEDGISMCQVADGALAEVHKMLDRLTELSVQSANGTNSEEDRQAIQAEVNEILSEIDRISETTDFNNINVFKGTSYMPSKGYCIAPDGTVSTVEEGTEMRDDYQYYADTIVGDISTTRIKKYIANQDFIIQGHKKWDWNDRIHICDAIKVTAGEEVPNYKSSSIKKAYINGEDAVDPNKLWVSHSTYQNYKITKGEMTFLNSSEVICAEPNTDVYSFLERELDSTGRYELKVGSKVFYDSVSDYRDLCEEKTVTGLVSDEDTYVLDKTSGEIKVLLAGTDLTGYVKSDGTGDLNYATIDSNSVTGKGNYGKKIWIQSGVTPEDGMYLNFGKMNTSVLGINDMDVSSKAGAKDSLDKIRSANDILSQIRSDIGAQQNRLEHTVISNENTSENLQAAESRLRDTDMAEEMVNNSKTNIIQQVSQSMLVNANQSKQGILTLLQ